MPPRHTFSKYVQRCQKLAADVQRSRTWKVYNLYIIYNLIGIGAVDVVTQIYRRKSGSHSQLGMTSGCDGCREIHTARGVSGKKRNEPGVH